MAVSKKNRRKIVVGQREFVWYVCEDMEAFPDGAENDLRAVNVLSDNRAFVARYHIGQSIPERRYVTILGPEFGWRMEPGNWRRFLCPDWCPDRVVTPEVVRQIIEWCLDPLPRVAVDFYGRPVESQGNEPG